LHRLQAEFSEQCRQKDSRILELEQTIKSGNSNASMNTTMTEETHKTINLLQDRLQKAGAHLKRLAQENTDLRNRDAELTESIKSLTVTNSNSKPNSNTSEDMVPKSEHDFYREYATRLEQNLQESGATEMALQDKISKLEKLIIEMKQEKNNSSISPIPNSDWQSDIDKLTQQLKDSQTEIVQISSMKENEINELKDKLNEMTTLFKEHEEKSQKNIKIDQQKEAEILQAKIVSLVQENNEQKKTHHKAMKELQNKYEALNLNSAEIAVAFEKTEIELKKSINEIDALKRENQNLTENLSQLSEKISQTGSDKVELCNTTQQEKEYENRINDLVIEIQKLKEDKNKTDLFMDEIKKQSEAEKKKFEETLKTKEVQLVTVQNSLEKKQNDLQEELSKNVKDVNQKFAEKLASFEKQNDILKKELENANQNAKSAEKDVNSIPLLKEKLSEMNSKLLESTQALANMKDAASAIQIELESKFENQLREQEKKHMAELLAEKNQWQSVINSIKNDSKEMQELNMNTLSEMKNIISKKETDLKKAEDELSLHQDKVKTLETKAAEYEETAENMRQDLESLNLKFIDLQSRDMFRNAEKKNFFFNCS